MHVTSFHEAYRSLLCAISNWSIQETNSRTGVDINMLEGGYSFKLDLSDGKLPVVGNRRYWPHVAAAETAWQFMGTRSPDWILEKAPKIWKDFVEEGELKTAYGYRWRKHFGRDQLAMAIDQLKNNPTNRQLYISAWDPTTDGLGAPDQPKNIPCPVGFSLTRTEDKIHGSVFIRSSDVFIGLPYDVMGYSLTLDAIAVSCGCTPGTIHFTLAHPHYYEPHYRIVEDCLTGTHQSWSIHDVRPNLPAWSVEAIEKSPDAYVDHVRILANRVRHNPWNPMPELVI